MLILACMVMAGSAFAIQELNVLTGFYREAGSTGTINRTYRDVRYTLKVGTVPMDRLQIRQTNIIYVEQFPDNYELLRDDLESLHKMMHDGGVLFLVAGPDSSASTIKNFNYIGKTRFNFEFTERRLDGHILPEVPGQGPLNGNVFFCEKGMRPIQLSGGGWTIHYRGSDAKSVVAASQRVNKGLLVVLGTRELDRPNESNPQSAITLMDWAQTWTKNEAAPTIPAQSIYDLSRDQLLDRVTFSSAEIDQMMKQPSSDLLADRVMTLRKVIGSSEKAAKLTGSPFLIPKEERSFFPRLGSAFDLQGSIINTDDFRGSFVLVLYWATWDSRSTEVIREIAKVWPELESRGVEIVPVNLDRSADTVRAFAKELNVDWRHVHDGRGYESPVLLRPTIRQIPRTFLLDRDGRICAQDIPPHLLLKAVKDAIAEPY